VRASVTSSWAPRAGSEERQYEDAFYPRASGDRHARRLRFAVADGASESMLSGLWADLLVRTWCKARRRAMPQIIKAASEFWEIELAAYLEQRERSQRPIQWFEEPGLEKGAFATLLGIAFSTTTHAEGTWRASSLGDTCLFQVRDGSLVASFPLERSADFDSRPKLVPSRPTDIAKVVGALDHAEGTWQTGDTFFLATDAVSAWFLRATEAGLSPWKTWTGFDAADPTAYRQWVAEQRGQGELRNDDSTVMRIEVR
jgi:hypothetical protein